jgi:predicted dehydrogenase
VKAFRANPHCAIAAICDHNPEKQERARELYPEARVVTEAGAVLDDPSIDIVSIASFDDDHFEQVTRALASGKHVFVEKPLCQTMEQLREIKRVWSSASRPLSLRSNLVLRGAPLYRWLRDRVRGGDLGEIYSFDGDYLYGRLPKITEGWRASVPGYSVLAGGGVHLIDLLGWVVGQRPRRLSARGNGICSRGTQFRYDDFVAATLEYDSGLIARITANFGCVHGHQHVVRAFGTRATFIYDDQGPRLQTHRDPAPPAHRIEEAPLPASKGVLINDFVHSVLTGAGSGDETQADFDTVSICFAGDAALRTQSTVEVEYV